MAIGVGAFQVLNDSGVFILSSFNGIDAIIATY